MSLSSIEFVLLLPTLIGVYWLLFDRRIQQIYLALVTALFIGFAGRFHLWVLAGVLGATMLVIRAANRSASRQQQIIRAGIIGLVVVLLSFKYLSWGFSLVGLQVIPPRQPIGISYYTFILIGFLVDRSRSHRPLTARRVLSLLLFFPFLTSGPIVRLRSWSAQNPRGRKRRVMRNVTIGAHSFMIGLMKKVMIADAIAVSTAPVWANPGQYGRTALAVAIVGFYVQLYADFSGYTDMARGVARML